MSLAGTSDGFQYRHVAMSIAGIAALYGAYKLYELSRQPPATLHRSNAVRRPHQRHGSTQHHEEIMEHAETEDTEMPNPDGDRAPSDGLRGLLYYIAEDNAKRKAYVHRGITCEGCGQFPILGIRYHCLNCPDYDLCAACEANEVSHPNTHVFAKIKVPLSLLSQPTMEHRNWYAGDPHKRDMPLVLSTKKAMSEEFGLELADIDALYDVFTCNANVAFGDEELRGLPQGYIQVHAAISRAAFNKAMTSERWKNRFAPNVILDRVFCFYDTLKDGVIDFQEFMEGMAYLRGPKRFESLERAIRGFDMDEDGFVSREDFLRLLRGKFEIQKQLIIDSIEVMETQHTEEAVDSLRSSQPISSIFNAESIPPGQDRPVRGKTLNASGDMEPENAVKTVLDDEDPFYPVQQPPQTGEDAQARLIAQLDRFEDILDGHSDWPQDQVESDQMRSILAARSPNEHPDPFVPAILWHMQEAAFNEMLDPLFLEKEVIARKVRATREERARWRHAIDDFKRQRAEVAPGVADLLSDEMRESSMKQAVVPTDAETLERREAEIRNAPLEVLLAVNNYSIREEEEGEEGGQGHPQEKDHIEPTEPDTSELGHPPPKLLAEYSILDEIERENERRGGAGRLSLKEVEAAVVDSSSQDLRGLVKSWLEWAAF